MSKAAVRSLGRRSPRVATKVELPAIRRPSTKELLMDTAEQLFGRLGVDGVSLREISVAGRQANTNAVQYHFKDKSGLIAAILEDRVGRIEALRRDHLEAMDAAGRNDARMLLRALWIPILSIRDADGVHTFCRFLLQVMLQARVEQHPVHKLYSADNRTRGSGANLTYVAKATRMLRAHYDHLPQAILNTRLSSLSMMFLATVVEHDNAKLSGKLDSRSEFQPDLLVDMALGALGVRSRNPDS
jgi:AcrR family transcriptional regulator